MVIYDKKLNVEAMNVFRKRLLAFCLFSTLICAQSFCQKELPALDSKPVSAAQASERGKEDSFIQYFKLCANATFSTPDYLHDYIVRQYDGVSASQLYENVFLCANKSYATPKTSVNGIENKMVQIEGYKEGITRHGKYKVSMNYRLQFEFKDGKVKVDAPVIISIWEGNYKIDNVAQYVGKRLWNTKSVKEIETYFNKILTAIILSADRENEW